MNDSSQIGKPGANVPLFSSIKFKSWLGILILTIVPLVSIGYYSFSVLANISRDLLIESNIQAFQQVKYEVDQYVAMYEDLSRFLANDHRLKNPESVEAWQALQQLDQSYEYVERIVLCDSDGNLLRHSKPDETLISELTVPEKMLAGSSLSIMFSPEAFLVRAPVSTAPDSPLLITTISFLKLRKSLEGITFGTNFRYFLVTQEGENLLDQPDFPQELISDLMQRPCGAYDVSAKSGGADHQVAISLPILHYNLRIFVFQNAGEVYAVASTIKSRTLNFVVVVGLLALILGTYLSMKLTAPVIEIAEKANELSEGNLDVKVDSNRKDELGFLAGCFNNMSRRIRNKVFELSALYRVSQVINASSTYQQALDECLSHLIEIFKADRGSIMLLNDDRTRLGVESFRQAGQIDQETTGERKGRFQLEVGEGIAGEVVATGKPILCMDCASDERFKNYDSQNGPKPPDTLVSVPLIVHGTCVGVVNLSDRSNSEPFNNEDLDLLQAIASQMAMSIDNARLHELTITDSLTELYIQKYFHIRLEDEIKRARRFNFPLTLVVFDVDKLKDVNDEYGMKMGDAVLWEIARILKESVRATDIPCRSGPEEFAVILAHTNAEQALIFAERLRERIAAFKITRAEKSVMVTISMGIAQYNVGIETPDDLVNLADMAVNESKSKGGNKTTTSENEPGGND
ncbi:MAG: two-component system, cell cycle response regulator [Clostridiales bacterium]|jgi:diguanylate cyclase (GGDEF)-like protein|nr:two-component system, cell cycle response regulator [Clostridiales bacterium]MDN5283329.1 two-component system, cell cycle response regulator [Candidatus Ozemobacter sp.]